MSRITLQTQLDSVLALFGEAPGIGQRIDELADYAWLDEEMMKVGSLRHGEVDWAEAETCALRLLSEEGKDLKVLGHLLHCLQQDGDAVRFALSLQLLDGVLSTWWLNAWPFSGPRGAHARQRLFVQFAQRSAKLGATLDFGGGGDSERDACQAACTQLIATAQQQELPVDALGPLQRTLAEADIAPAIAQETAPTPATRATNNGAETSKDDRNAKVPDVHLESGNERANRQALLKMAEFLNAQSPSEPLGYRLRRHAIWHAIHTLPGTRDGQRTELAPVSADRTAEYRERLARDADPALWHRIEASLAVSPYWLEGHRLSAEAASALKHHACAEAIREEAAGFVERLPGLTTLTFNDGTPFVDATTREWLVGTTSRTDPIASGQGDPWQAGLETARERLAEEGLQAALTILDAGLAEARSPRDRAYWRLANAELLSEAGLTALAQQHYQALQQALADIDLAHWEPALLARLEASLAT